MSRRFSGGILRLIHVKFSLETRMWLNTNKLLSVLTHKPCEVFLDLWISHSIYLTLLIEVGSESSAISRTDREWTTKFICCKINEKCDHVQMSQAFSRFHSRFIRKLLTALKPTKLSASAHGGNNHLSRCHSGLVKYDTILQVLWCMVATQSNSPER